MAGLRPRRLGAPNLGKALPFDGAGPACAEAGPGQVQALAETSASLAG
ncbi:MAG: hypothetical protein IT318_08185 [Anaerolineales bacterium]|nr:hypothetical protein [Anaerolineales bacterium]